MNEETIYDQNEVKEEKQGNAPLSNDETVFDRQQDSKQDEAPKDKKKRDFKMAGIAGAAGVAGAVLGVLTPVNVFPIAPENGNEIGEIGEPEQAPTVSGHYQGHDMDVATGVNDSMSFSQAFAAARQEVGPGGLFVWHGNTYGTYYANEWNAMTPEDREQYWADVHHTTSHIEYEPTQQPEISDPSINNLEVDNPVASNNTQEPEVQDEPVVDNPVASNNTQEPAVQDEPVLDNPTPEVLNLNEENVVEVFDLDEDGQIDAAIVDANGNDMPDIVMDTTGDGDMDTLILDVNENLEGEVVEIAGVNIVASEEQVADSLILDGDDVLDVVDVDGDGQTDAWIVDANGNETPDLLLDTTGNGDMDTLILDPDVDGEGNLIVDDNNVHENVEVLMTGVEEPTFEDDLLDGSTFADNADVDDSADLSFNPNISIDNDMDMSDFA